MAAAMREVHHPVDVDEPCEVETYSWDHYRQTQIDPYWIRCTRVGAHPKHEDSNTGLTWDWDEHDPPKPLPQVCDGCYETWPCETEKRLTSGSMPEPTSEQEALDRVRAEALADAAADIKDRIKTFRDLNADPQYLNALNDAWGLVSNRRRSHLPPGERT